MSPGKYTITTSNPAVTRIVNDVKYAANGAFTGSAVGAIVTIGTATLSATASGMIVPLVLSAVGGAVGAYLGERKWSEAAKQNLYVTTNYDSTLAGPAVGPVEIDVVHPIQPTGARAGDPLGKNAPDK